MRKIFLTIICCFLVLGFVSLTWAIDAEIKGPKFKKIGIGRSISFQNTRSKLVDHWWYHNGSCWDRGWAHATSSKRTLNGLGRHTIQCRVYRNLWSPEEDWDTEYVDTQYPVVLSHGMGANNEMYIGIPYWYGDFIGPTIKEALEEEGARVFETSVQGLNDTLVKAENWASQIKQILAITGSPKVNVIGHSHGTIYSRAGMQDYLPPDTVAHHISIAGPHRGSAVAEVLISGAIDKLGIPIDDILDIAYEYILGEDNPDGYENGKDLLWSEMKAFNDTYPNSNTPNTTYQSWTGDSRFSLLLEVGVLILNNYEGISDGLVSNWSGNWGTYHGNVSPVGFVDHLNIIGHPLGLDVMDVTQFYRNVYNNYIPKL